MGQHIEVNLLSSALSALVNQASAYLGAGANPTFLGNAHPSITPYETYRAADMPIVIALGNDTQFATFAKVLEQPQWAIDARFVTNADRVAHRAELAQEINDVLSTEVAEYWFSLLTAAGLPAGPINSVPQAFAFAESLGLNPRISISSDTDRRAPDQVANPIHLSRTPVTYRRNPPHLGADNDRLKKSPAEEE
jgi:crotonobetainyl-CoA:carnitine CoA-transferase CaiB-like acyl-CoA transferase